MPLFECPFIHISGRHKWSWYEKNCVNHLATTELAVIHFIIFVFPPLLLHFVSVRPSYIMKWDALLSLLALYYFDETQLCEWSTDYIQMDAFISVSLGLTIQFRIFLSFAISVCFNIHLYVFQSTKFNGKSCSISSESRIVGRNSFMSMPGMPFSWLNIAKQRVWTLRCLAIIIKWVWFGLASGTINQGQ